MTDDTGASTRSASLNFAEYAATANLFDGYPVGSSYVTVALGDLDDDGDLDIVLGNFAGRFTIVTNTGTPTAPMIAGATTQFFDISVGLFSAPTLGDLDDDGDLDMVVGSRDSGLFKLINTGTAAAPVFEIGGLIHIDGIDGTLPLSPALGDLDGDGDLDIVMGLYGGLFTVTNSGTAAAPIFDAPVPIPGANIGFYAAPALGDLDGDARSRHHCGEF